MNTEKMVVLEQLEEQQDLSLTELLSTLQDEFSALKQRRMQDLTEITQRKQELLKVIQNIDNDIAQQLEQHPQQAVKPDKKQMLKEKLQHCQNQNEINGHLLELSLMTNRRFAHFFTCMRDEGSLTYDAKGNTSVANRSQSFKI